MVDVEVDPDGDADGEAVLDIFTSFPPYFGGCPTLRLVSVSL